MSECVCVCVCVVRVSMSASVCGGSISMRVSMRVSMSDAGVCKSRDHELPGTVRHLPANSSAGVSLSIGTGMSTL